MSLAKWIAQALACTPLFLLVSSLALGQGLHYTPQEVAAWRTRTTAGPYRVAGDAGTNTPPDWSRIVQFSDDFRTSPMDTGNTDEENLDIWTGYRYQYDSLDQYPIWQGIKMEAAAFRFLLSGDTSYGEAVRRTLLAQIRFSHPIHIGYNVATWPAPSNNNVKPTYESGAKEAIWLSRLMFAYDYAKTLFSPTEQDEVEAYLKNSAWYFAGRINRELIRHFPNRLQNNYTVKTYAAAPGGVPQWNPPIFAPAQFSRHQVWGDGFVYTHRNANGSLGNRIPRIGYWYNNRVFEKMHFVGLCGILVNDTLLTWHAKQTTKEFIQYSVFPDGTYAEYERNGDYANPNQGSHLYGSMNLQAIVMLADALARKGDKSLYRFATREGVHGTQVLPTGAPKSLFTVLDKYAKTSVGSPDIYWGNVASINRIDINNENINSTFTINHVTWDYLLAVANKYYRSDFLRNVYTRRSSVGAMAYPTTRLTSAGKVWIPWSGTGAEYPGFLFMFGQLESTSAYTTDCQTPLGLASSNVTATSAQLTWNAFGAASQGYRVEYKPTAGSTWTALRAGSNTITVSGLGAATAYQVRVKSLCSATDSSAASAVSTFTTLTATCPAPSGIAITGLSASELSVNATGGTGVLQFRIEYRLLGASSWSQITTSTIPATIGGLAALTAYEVRVTSICATNSSAPSILFVGTTLQAACTQGSNLRGTPVAATDSAKLDWNAGGGASQYQIRLRAQGTSNWKFVVVSQPTHKEGALLANTTYEFQVNTICQSGISGYTASRSFTMPAAACPEASSVSVTGITSNSATANFVGTGTSYEVRYKPTTSTTWISTTVASSPAAITGLLANTVYELQVRTLCATSNSAYSPAVTFTTPAPPCLAATNVVGTATSPTTASITFSNAALAEVSYKLTSSSTWVVGLASAASPAVLTGLDDANTYDIRVVARCGSNTAPAVFTTVTLPAAPIPCDTLRNLAISNVQTSGAIVSWQAVSGNTRGYNIRYRAIGAANWTNLSTAGTTVSLSSLSAATRFELQAQNLCVGTQESAWSRSRFFTTVALPCTTPTLVSTRFIGTDSIVAEWALVPSTISYRLRITDLSSGTQREFTVGPQATSLGIGNLLAGRTYQLMLQSNCSAGQSTWATNTVIVPLPCTATGIVRRETWTGITNWSAGQGTPTSGPNRIAPINQIRDSVRGAVNTLNRVRGYICAPTTGTYFFGLAGGLRAELRMATNLADTNTITRLITLGGRTNLQTFAANQRSQAVNLVAGGKYLVEVLYYSSDDMVGFNLAWQVPQAQTLVTVPSAVFSTSAPPSTTVTTIKSTAPNYTWALAPNPAGAAGTRLFGPVGEVMVHIHDAAGKLVGQGSKHIADQIPADLTELLPITPGIYAVSAHSKAGVYRARLIRE